jgi:hypothetical protein
MVRSIKLLLFAVCLCSCLCNAQTFGTISGAVRDPSGAVIPSARVTVTNTATNVSRNSVTNNEGIYAFPALVPGPYEVRVEVPGFRTASSKLELQVQQSARVDFALQVGQTSETIEVSAAAALLATDNATVGSVIEERRIVELPLNGRNFTYSCPAWTPFRSSKYRPASTRPNSAVQPAR